MTAQMVATAGLATGLLVLLASRGRGLMRPHRRNPLAQPGHHAGRILPVVVARIDSFLRRSGRRSSGSTLEHAAMLDDIARRCASGESLRSAFATAIEASARADTWHATAQRLASGASLTEALAEQSVDDAAHRVTVHVLRICATNGGAMSESIDRAASTLRERHAVQAERHAQAAQARLSAQVLTLVPLAFSAWTLATSPNVQRFVTTSLGISCLVIGCLLNVTGWQLMKRAIGGER